MEIVLVSLLNGLVYGMLLFMLASGLTLIFSMMGVLNFAHASIYMIGAYLAFTVSQFIGFFPALIIAPLLCGLLGAAIEVFGLRRVHSNGHIAELLFTFGLVFIIERVVQMTWGMLPMPYRVPPLLDFPLFTFYGQYFPAYRGFMLLVSAGMLLATWLLLKKTRVGLIIQASLTHPQMASALGHNVPAVFTLVFAGGCVLAGLAGVIGGNYQTTEPGMADSHGADRVRGRGVRRARLADGLLRRLDPDGHDHDLCGRDQCLAARPAQAARHHALRRQSVHGVHDRAGRAHRRAAAVPADDLHPDGAAARPDGNA